MSDAALPWSRTWVRLWVALVLTAAPATAGVPAPLVLENAEIHTAVDAVAQRTGTTFLFDPERVKGRITILGAGTVSPDRALELLRSALALHGYVLVERPEGTWIVPAHEIAGDDFVVEVVRLTYADAADVAFTLGWVAPPGLRIVPFRPTNSIVIAGHATDVERMLGLLRRR